LQHIASVAAHLLIADSWGSPRRSEVNPWQCTTRCHLHDSGWVFPKKRSRHAYQEQERTQFTANLTIHCHSDDFISWEWTPLV